MQRIESDGFEPILYSRDQLASFCTSSAYIDFFL
jgi:hypothetical protein